jgi:hypothetical protein
MNFLGWMTAPAQSLAEWDEHRRLAAAARADGLDYTLVCGWARPRRRRWQRRSQEQPQVLDSTNPDAIRAVERAHDPARTLFLITSKSATRSRRWPCNIFPRARCPDRTRGHHRTDTLDTLARERDRAARRTSVSAPGLRADGGRCRRLRY